jgi:hypothetical protein
VAYATGTRIELLNIGAGTVTLSPAGGVTLTGTTSVPQNARVVLVKQATNTWYCNALGGGGLTLITTATVSAAASLSVNNCFTSAYENYLIHMGQVTASTSDDFLNLRLRASSADNTTSNYNWARLIGSSAAAATASGSRATNLFQIHTVSSSSPSPVVIQVTSPQLAANTGFLSSSNYDNGTNMYTFAHGGIFKATTQFDGFSIFPTTGTITATARIYGYSNS